jgi:hypothetical protein
MRKLYALHEPLSTTRHSNTAPFRGNCLVARLSGTSSFYFKGITSNNTRIGAVLQPDF